MRRSRRLASYLKVALWLALVGIFYVLLAPAEIGGRSAYAIITGNSMEPALKRGDLAVVRQTGDYQVGDVVVYNHPSLGRVIHRIIVQDGEHFVLQGDNNSWTDGYRPVAEEIAGELWVALPRAGRVVWGFRTPFGAALLAGVISFLLFWPEGQKREDAAPGPAAGRAEKAPKRLPVSRPAR
jgi:signal peptidase I